MIKENKLEEWYLKVSRLDDESTFEINANAWNQWKILDVKFFKTLKIWTIQKWKWKTKIKITVISNGCKCANGINK